MSRYLARRTLQSLPLLLAVGTLGFLLVHLAPGDAVIALSGEFAHEEIQEALRRSYGLDRSLAAQYAIFMTKLATGDLGVSYYFGEPVTKVILERLPATLLLVIPSLILSVSLGALAGVFASTGRRRKRAFLAAAVALSGMPVFWIGQLLLLALAVRLDVFPVQGMLDAREESFGLARILDLVRHMVLPVAALTLQQVALVAVLTGTSLDRELGREYVRAARGRGLPPARVRAHAFRNAIIPVIAAVGARIGAVASGAVLVETVFAWPGLGRLATVAAMSRDTPLVLGIFFFITLAVLTANLATDVVCALADPRIRLR